VGTGNSTDNIRVPCPSAPSLVVLDKDTGRLLAVDDANIAPGVYHGQWSSPTLGTVNGRPLIFYGGGDGFCYAFDANPLPTREGEPGVLRKVWWFDCNPPEYKSNKGRPISYTRTTGYGPAEVMATPVFYKNRVLAATGLEPGHDPGKGCLSCIDATGAGDISKSGLVWTYKDIARSLSTVSVADGLVYIGDFAGTVHCLDFETGKCYWKYDAGREIWASTLVADGKIYVCNTRGEMHVLAAGKELKLISKVILGKGIYASPVAANGVLYVATKTHLYALQADKN
jgi:outer membrane protein assembly factor BamB